MGPLTAVPDVAKLTGAWVTRTASTAGAEAGVDSCARQRTPCTVSKKFSASLVDAAVTGKKSDQYSLPPEEYGWRKLIRSATAEPLEPRVTWRKSRTVVD